MESHGPSWSRRLLLGLWIGVAIQLVGQIVDVGWHAAHGSHFRRASEQVQAHWVIWLGIAVMLVVSAAAVRGGHARASRGFLLALLASGLLAVAQAWNFWEHARGRSSAPAHVIMMVTRVGVVVASVWVTQDLLGHSSEAADFFKGTRRFS
jgi:hypothetical protein